jgi:hypothetical protein
MAAGVDQSVAMRVTGHQTISVFQRYRIVSDDDVRAALQRTQAALGGRSGRCRGTNRGTTMVMMSLASERASRKCAV